MDDLSWYLGITATGAVAVVISSVVMYAAFALVLHLWGEHLRDRSSNLTIAVAALLGAIAARATMGQTPTMAGGLIAMSTLLAMEQVFGAVRRAGRAFAHRHDAPPSPEDGAA